MDRFKGFQVPQGPLPGRLIRALAVGGVVLYGAANSLFNVEGGHRAIVFNRVVGLKEKARLETHVHPSETRRGPNADKCFCPDL